MYQMIGWVISNISTEGDELIHSKSELQYAGIKAMELMKISFRQTKRTSIKMA